MFKIQNMKKNSLRVVNARENVVVRYRKLIDLVHLFEEKILEYGEDAIFDYEAPYYDDSPITSYIQYKRFETQEEYAARLLQEEAKDNQKEHELRLLKQLKEKYPGV